MRLSSVLTALACATLTHAAIPDEDWDYVQVRPGNFLFYWLYGCNSTTVLRENAPIILWTNGGPGAGSSGYGNWGEMGPRDTNMNPRNTSWIYAANIVYIDQPVGSGFSYTVNNGYVTTNQEIADDLVTFMKAFVKIYPEAQTLPFFVFCESYGGKMVIQFANSLLQAIDQGEINVNFRGVALGDSWISPIDFVDTWGPLLRGLSLMEENELQNMNNQSVYPCDQAVANGQWTDATNYWGDTENFVSQYSCVDFYNYLQVDCGNGNSMPIQARNGYPSSALFDKPLLSPEALALAPKGINHTILESLYRRHVYRYMDEDITTFMNTVVRPMLKIIPDNVTWGGQSGMVFSTLSGDFMRPVIDVVDTVLSLNKINVTIYEGQLDLICATVGADLWMTRLQWPGMVNYYKSAKVPLSPFPGGPTGAFKRSYENLSMYKILMAGHMVPADNGDMALVMVQDILNSQS